MCIKNNMNKNDVAIYSLFKDISLVFKTITYWQVQQQHKLEAAGYPPIRCIIMKNTELGYWIIQTWEKNWCYWMDDSIQHWFVWFDYRKQEGGKELEAEVIMSKNVEGERLNEVALLLNFYEAPLENLWRRSISVFLNETDPCFI